MRVFEPAGTYDVPEEVRAFNTFADWHNESFVTKLFRAKVLQFCSDKAEILDVGAGGGQLAVSLALAREAPVVTVMDCSPHMLDLAQQRAAQCGVQEQMRFRKADAGAGLPFADNSFDVLVCHLALHEIRDVEAFIREVKRVVKAEGAVFIKDIIRMPAAIQKVFPWRLFSFDKRMAQQTFQSWRAALSYWELRRVRDALGSDYRIRCNFFRAAIYPKRVKIK